MFERNLISELRDWAAKPGHKPLVLRGARQVGKSTLANQFGEEYDVYLKLNLAWGGFWGGAQGVDETSLPATYQIDYVRVFQKK